ncbi:hypothetical protein B566_EDAN006998 [Ephemera danica]|nr:hypothetical protein B566_EDAN006998 [Ephemera danica]
MASMATMLKKLINSSNSRHLLVKCTSLSALNERPALVASLGALRLNCTAKIITQEDDKNESKPKEKVSKAMKAYLERATAHEEFMKKERADFQIGKRHLANMMGVDADTMTQEYIDKAIEYLFPSGLFERKARPIMKPPEQVFPQRKAAEFDVTGRPHHKLFYTMNANFYQLMFNAVSHLEMLDKEEDAIIRRGGQVDSSLKFDASGSEWFPKEILETKMVEKLNDSQPSYDSEGRAYVTVKGLVQTNGTIILQHFRDSFCVVECLRKRARGEVTVRVPGTGKFSVNGQDIVYFSNIQCREQLR